MGSRNRRVLIFGLVVYVLISVCVWWRFPPSWNQLTKDALVIGLLTNAIFALTFGIVSALVALVKPEDELFEKRFWFLFPQSESLTKEAKSGLMEGARKLAAPAIRGTIFMSVDDHDATCSAFHVCTDITYTLQNLLKNEGYEDHEMEISLTPDDVPKDRVGLIEFAQFTCGSTDIFLQSVPIARSARDFRHRILMKIPPAGTGDFRYRYWAWAKENVPWSWQVQRYTEGVKFILKNLTAKRVRYSIETKVSHAATQNQVLGTGVLEVADAEATIATDIRLRPSVSLWLVLSVEP
jgi:hypothetical protein